jgi:predicted Zn-dependent peptidase
MLESLDKITLNDVKEFHNDILTKGQGKVTVTGPFDKNSELKDVIFESVNSYPQLNKKDISLEKVYTPIEKTEILTDINLKNQTDIIQGYRYKNSGNIKDENCVALLNEILGGSPSSRLFMDLRENKHLAYAVSSNYSTLGDMGVYTLEIGTTTENHETGEKTFDNVQKAIEGFNDNIKKITSEKVSEAELNAAKKRLKSQIYTALETNNGKNRIISHSKDTFYGIEYLNKCLENIDSITADDIYNTANNIFNSRPIYSLTGTKATIEANKDFLSNLAG